MKRKKTCARCGKTFMGDTKDYLCAACTASVVIARRRDESRSVKQSAVMNYVRDHQGVSRQEVVKNVGVSKGFLNNMIREDFFGTAIRKGKKYPHPCAGCGVTIQTGVYCKNCLDLLRNEARSVGERKDMNKRVKQEEKVQAKRDNLILVVDGNANDLKETRLILEGKLPSHTIQTANDLMTVIQIMHGLKVKLVLIDDLVSLKYNGLAILKEIKNDYAIENVPVIMTAAQESERKRAKAEELGIIDYIVKPFDADDLAERVSKILEHEVEIVQSKVYHFLLIDDDEEDAEIEKKILEENFHCRVATAESGVEGMTVMHDQKINLVLISHEMSFMDGMQVLHFIKQDKNFKDIPVVLLKNNPDSKFFEELNRENALGYINKPVISADGLALIEDILSGKAEQNEI